MTLVYFALLLGALIFFHEFGHFIVARACGIRVLEFSIGFGPEVAAIERGGTVYRIGALPLGGFVRMLGADPTEEIPPEDAVDAFGSKPLWQRTLVVLAGPVFNLILPLFIFFFMYVTVAAVPPASIGTLQPGGVADRAGLMAGDVVTEVDGEPVEGWWQLERIIRTSGNKALSLTINRQGKTLPAIELKPALVEETVAPELGLTEDVGRVQITHAYRRPFVSVDRGSRAYDSGLRTFDLITAIDGKPTSSWENTLRQLETMREVKRGVAAGPPADTVQKSNAAHSAQKVTVSRVVLASWWQGLKRETHTFKIAGGSISTLGLRSSEFVILGLLPDGVEASNGLKPGDEILSLDGRKFALWFMAVDYIVNHPEQAIEVKYRRDGQEFTKTMTWPVRTEKREFNTEVKAVSVGMYALTAYDAPERVANEHNVAYALYHMWTDTGRVMTLTIASLAGLFTGKVEFKQMGGPIFIYEVASKTGEHGWSYFFNVMVWLSISLGLINLLPIPLLDGGHLAFFLIEAIKRRPVSLRVRQVASYIGLSMIIVLMVMVFKNDIQRNWDSVIAYFQ